MNPVDLLWPLAKATTFVLATGLFVLLAVGFLRFKSPRLCQLAWCCVLLQGVLLFHFPIQLTIENTPRRNSGVPATTNEPDTAVVAVSNAIELPASATELQSDSPLPGKAATASFVLSSLLVFAWCAGMIWILVRRIVDYCAFLKLADCRTCSEDIWLQELAQIHREQNVAKPIPLFVSPSVGPAVCRWPGGYRIIVPDRLWQQLSSQDRLMVLRHEIAHLQRGDLLMSLAMHMLALPHWFNPMAWIALREIEKNAELACDDIVCSGQIAATDYAKTLLTIGVGSPVRGGFAVGIDGSNCAARIRRVLSFDRRHEAMWKPTIVLSLLTLFLLAHVMRFDVVAKQPQEEAAVVLASDAGREPSSTKTVVVSNQRFEQAAAALREIGGFVRSFHPRTSTKNWVQVILDGEKLTAPADDDALNAVKVLSTDSKTHFHARDCRFSPDGMKKLAGTKISRLELTGPNITDAHLEPLQHLDHMTELTLADTRISRAGFAAIQDCKQLMSIGLARNLELSGASLAMLSHLPQLTSVSIHESLTAALVTELNKINGLKSLRLTIADEKAMQAFASLTCFGVLEELTLSGERVSEPMIILLAKRSPHLKALYLRGSQGVSSEAVRGLAELPLEVLAFDRTNITDVGVSLLKPLKQLRWLDLTGTKVTDRSLIAIGNMDELQFLSLSQTDISEAGLERLKRLEKLTHVDLQVTSVKTIPAWMKKRERLYISFDGRLQNAGQPHAEDGSDLARAVAEFNKTASKHPIGKFEPSLTVDEVIAAIHSWNREQIPVDDETLAVFERIAETKELPDGAKIDSTSGWRTNKFHYTVWWIDLSVKTGERRGYTYRLRARTLNSRRLVE